MIKATGSTYRVTATSIVNGEATSVKFDMPERDTKAAKRIAAEQLGVKASRVIVDIERETWTIDVDATRDDFTSALRGAFIQYDFV